MPGSVLENVLSVLGSILWADLGAYSDAGWECHRVQLGVYLRACLGVCLKASWELVWECTVKQAGSVPSSTSESVLGSMPGSVLENVLGVYLGASCELTWRCIVKQAGSVSSSAIGSVLENVLESMLEIVLRAYLGAYSQAGWESAIECNCERPWEHARECTWECTRCAYPGTRTALRAHLGAYVKQAGSVIRSVLQSLLGIMQWRAFDSFIECSVMYGIKRQ